MQEILRVHGRAARALANQSLPYSVCTILRDEEIYTPIDPNQEEKNRDIRSRSEATHTGLRIRIRIRINSSCRIRIRIQIADPDPGGQK